MTFYRITRLTCAGCSSYQRVKVAVDDDGETYPECRSCGITDWTGSSPQRPAPPVVTEQQVERFYGDISTDETLIAQQLSGVRFEDGEERIVSQREAAEFWAHFAAEQNEYIARRFAAWMDERDAAVQVQLDEQRGSRARMYRELWTILDQPGS